MPKGGSEQKRGEGSLLGRAVEGHRDPELTCSLLSLTILAAVRTGLSGWVWRREEGGGGGANCSMVGRCKSGRGEERWSGAGRGREGAGGPERARLGGRIASTPTFTVHKNSLLVSFFVLMAQPHAFTGTRRDTHGN